jgi:hypothetical protein
MNDAQSLNRSFWSSITKHSAMGDQNFILHKGDRDAKIIVDPQLDLTCGGGKRR